MENEKEEVIGTLGFSVQGEFITKLAKEWFFDEFKPYSQVEELLLSCMCGTDETKATLQKYAQDILLGRAELRGNSGDGTFCLAFLDSEETLNETNIFTAYSKLAKKYKETREELSEMNDKYCELVEKIENGEYDRYSRYRLNTVEYSPIKGTSRLVQDYIDARVKGVEYGWLSPEAKFYEVDFGGHQIWPYNSILERGRYDEVAAADLSHYKDEFEAWCKARKRPVVNAAADFLVDKGWVLVHSPSQGIPVLTSDTIRRLTKAQREFMFDYYINADQNDRASELYKLMDD